MSVPYAELALTSNFSFLRGASHPDELMRAGARAELCALGIADRNTLAGVVRAHMAARDAGIRLLVGARLVTRCGFEVLCYPEDLPAYGRLSALLTRGNRRAPKGDCYLDPDDILDARKGQVFIVMAPEKPDEHFGKQLSRFASAVRGQTYLALSLLYRGADRRRLEYLEEIAESANVPTIITNDVHYHDPERRILQDVLTATRLKVQVAQAGRALFANAERHVKSGAQMARIFAGREGALARTLDIVERCRFSLSELSYQYPEEILEPGCSAQQSLERLVWEGAGERFPEGMDASIRKTIQYELDLISSLNYAPYFLTVQDLVRFASEEKILCQGRGSAANSIVCYCLGITAVDPVRVDLLFDRFVSAERNEPPDIDVDFEHGRREEVIQYIYEKYGRHRAGIAATVITYRAKSAIRDVGKALGLSPDIVGALSRTIWGWSAEGVDPKHLREVGLDPEEPLLTRALALARELIGFPRHLSQHVGGFVMTRTPLDEVVPIANAAMPDRTFVEWDKDDLDALGILKVDVLALGMLSCIRIAFDFLKSHYGRELTLASIPSEDPAVYDMICKADTVGVFQIESRAQMSMLPRLKPRSYYDLVIEVAIVRPGPIQGDMVHPYLRRRLGEEEVSYPSPELEDILDKTLGVPLFQEQAMRIAMVAAGFTPSEADRLRRAMATFRKTGIIHEFGVRLIEGMVENGYDRQFAERCFRQIEGFGEYGFPESHAASFALLVYISSWIKCHYTDVFCCALLNAQPLGFYAPAQLVRDARDHGVEVRPVDINASFWQANLEPLGEAGAQTPEGGNRMAVRLGLRSVEGMREDAARALVAAREERGKPFASVRSLWAEARLERRSLEALARGDAFSSLGLTRRQALWEVKALEPDALPLFAACETPEPSVDLPVMGLGEEVVHDYRHLRLSLKAHPFHFLRSELTERGVVTAGDLSAAKDRARVIVAGLVLVRQRPGSAQGVIFVTLEDETGVANLVVWPKIFEAYRRIVMSARVLMVRGRVQKEGRVIHVVADELVDLSHMLSRLTPDNPEIEGVLAPSDEVRRNSEDPRQIASRKRQMVEERARAIIPPSRDFH